MERIVEKGMAPTAGAAQSHTDPLSLQGFDVVVETPADLYRSGNSVYTCVLMSGFSIAC